MNLNKSNDEKNNYIYKKKKKKKKSLEIIADKGVARNNYLGGPGCNRDKLNIIL